MKKIALLIVSLLLLQSCNQKKETQKQEPINEVAILSNDLDGYALMKQYCFACHSERPGMGNKTKMIAPPIMMVQRHYKPTYPNKEEFIKAIINWVNKPNADEVKMPGATRKFGLMPPLPIGDDKISAIAEHLYEMDFGENIGHGKKHRKRQGMHNDKLSLNNGGKWKLDKNDIERIAGINASLKDFKGKTLQDYHNFGKKIFKNAKAIMLNENYKGDTLEQVHVFFHTVEDDMHKLMGANSIDEGKKYMKLLEKSFQVFDQYFK